MFLPKDNPTKAIIARKMPDFDHLYWRGADPVVAVGLVLVGPVAGAIDWHTTSTMPSPRQVTNSSNLELSY
jgi:hypothetical protein